MSMSVYRISSNGLTSKIRTNGSSKDCNLTFFLIVFLYSRRVGSCESSLKRRRERGVKRGHLAGQELESQNSGEKNIAVSLLY